MKKSTASDFQEQAMQSCSNYREIKPMSQDIGKSC